MRPGLSERTTGAHRLSFTNWSASWGWAELSFICGRLPFGDVGLRVWKRRDKRLRSLCYNTEPTVSSNRNTMKLLALLIVAPTGVMVVIHVCKGKILNAWNEQGGWTRLCFPLRRALRTEASFWNLALAACPLWSSLAWKILVVMFAAVHVAVGGAGEFRRNRNSVSLSSASSAMQRAIVAFDLVEALFLAVLGVPARIRLSQPR